MKTYHTPCDGTVALNSWAGRIERKCKVVGETPKFYVVKFDRMTALSTRLWARPGIAVRVPKHAVRLDLTEVQS